MLLGQSTQNTPRRLRHGQLRRPAFKLGNGPPRASLSSPLCCITDPRRQRSPGTAASTAHRPGEEGLVPATHRVEEDCFSFKGSWSRLRRRPHPLRCARSLSLYPTSLHCLFTASFRPGTKINGGKVPLPLPCMTARKAFPGSHKTGCFGNRKALFKWPSVEGGESHRDAPTARTPRSYFGTKECDHALPVGYTNQKGQDTSNVHRRLPFVFERIYKYWMAVQNTANGIAFREGNG